MRSWKFSNSLSSVMFFRKESSVLIPGFDLSLSRDTNSTVSRLKWGTNSFTHEPLWVVTHTAWFTKSVDSKFSRVLIGSRKYNSEYPWIFTVLGRDSKWLLFSRQFRMRWNFSGEWKSCSNKYQETDKIWPVGVYCSKKFLFDFYPTDLVNTKTTTPLRVGL